MIIYNIREDINVQLYLKDIDGDDVGVFLKPGQFVFSPTDYKTKSINLQNIKRNIGIVTEEKPLDAEYFVVYDEDKRFFMYPQKPTQEIFVEHKKFKVDKMSKDKKFILNKKILLFSKNKVNKAKNEFIEELGKISKEYANIETEEKEKIEEIQILKEKEPVQEKMEIKDVIISNKDKKPKQLTVKEKKPLVPKVKIVSKPRNFILKNKKK